MPVDKYVAWNRNRGTSSSGSANANSMVTSVAPENMTIVGVRGGVMISASTAAVHGYVVLAVQGPGDSTTEFDGFSPSDDLFDQTTGGLMNQSKDNIWAVYPFAVEPSQGGTVFIPIDVKTKRNLRKGMRLKLVLSWARATATDASVTWSASLTAFVNT